MLEIKLLDLFITKTAMVRGYHKVVARAEDKLVWMKNFISGVVEGVHPVFAVKDHDALWLVFSAYDKHDLRVRIVSPVPGQHCEAVLVEMYLEAPTGSVIARNDFAISMVVDELDAALESGDVELARRKVSFLRDLLREDGVYTPAEMRDALTQALEKMQTINPD